MFVMCTREMFFCECAAAALDLRVGLNPRADYSRLITRLIRGRNGIIIMLDRPETKHWIPLMMPNGDPS